MKAIAMIMGTIMVVIGGYQLGQIKAPGEGVSSVSSEPAFDYRTASVEARAEWLISEASPHETRVKQALGLNRPTLSYLSYEETKPSPQTREIQYIVKMKSHVGGTFPQDLAAQLQDRLCPRYLGTQLELNKIRLSVIINRDNGSKAFSTSISTSQCARVAQLAAK